MASHFIQEVVVSLEVVVYEHLEIPSPIIITLCVLDTISSVQLDTEEVTVENSMSKSFDQIIKMQLDPIWNQLVRQQKQQLC